MPMLELVLAGQDASKAAEALEAVLTRETDLRPERRTARPNAANGPEKTVDPLAAAALILAVPAAILACVDLADRLRKRPKAEELIRTLNALTNNGDLSITITINQNGVPKPAQSLTPDQLLELAEQAADEKK